MSKQGKKGNASHASKPSTSSPSSSSQPNLSSNTATTQDFLKSNDVLQGVILADSFQIKFRPITLEQPKVLLPVANSAMLDYALEFLISGGVREIFIFCCSHAELINNYLNQSKWTQHSHSHNYSIRCINSNNCFSAGDALRHLDSLDIIKGDFVLLSGDVISNIKLESVIKLHKQRVQQDKRNIMTCVYKSASIHHETRTADDEMVIAINPQTQQLLYYENNINTATATIDLELFEDNKSIQFRRDLIDTYIDICTPQALLLFTDNFDYQHIRNDFIRGILGESVLGNKIFTHIIQGEYAARISDLKLYNAVSRDIIKRWTYPQVPDTNILNNSSYRFKRGNIYIEENVTQHRNSHIVADSMIGSGSKIGANSVINRSVIGKNCQIGENVSIINSYLWGNNVIEDNCKLDHAILCNGVKLSAGCTVDKGTILSYNVVIGPNMHIKPYTKITTVHPEQNDAEFSEEEGEKPSAAPKTVIISQNWSESEVGRGGIGRFYDSAVEMAEQADVAGDEDSEFAQFLQINSIFPDLSEVNAARAKQLAHEESEVESEDYSELENELENSSNQAPGSERNANNVSAAQNNANSTNPNSLLTPTNTTIDQSKVDAFIKEMKETLTRGQTENLPVDAIILEMATLKMAANANTNEYLQGVLLTILSWLSSDIEKKTNLSATEKEAAKRSLMEKEAAKPSLLGQLLKKWQESLRKYAKQTNEQIVLIQALETICLSSDRLYLPLFGPLLQLLHVNFEILSEDAILVWEESRKLSNNNLFLKQAETFLNWLHDAEEEEEDDEEEDD
jgi:translation initiation factor eIF-2B subunit epsilon